VITKNPEDLCAQSLRQLKRLSAVCPQAFMVHGNHDYHGHLPAVISKQLEHVGFHDINNHHIRLSIGGAPLNIYGVDDAYFGRPTPPSTVSSDETNIVLTHNLDAIRGDFPKGVDLILSGHTHWGELKLFDGVRLMNWWGYADNLNRHSRHWEMLTDRTRSYVHPGLARYYVPFRGLRHPPGVAIHTLVRRQEAAHRHNGSHQEPSILERENHRSSVPI
jgi:predicted MPP superfamily phosphohydrolase